MARTIIVGLGNDILSDDAAGIHVARRLAPLLKETRGVAVVEATVGGIRLIELLSGFDHAVIVDAIVRENEAPGTILRFTMCDFSPTTRTGALHDIDLPTALEMAMRIGMSIPHEIELIAIVASDVLTVSEEMCPEVEAAVNKVVSGLADRFASWSAGNRLK
ncbi:MAG: hydrogenase maturation protease [bacterium]|jgi:hydrogenase maturation protease